MATPTVDPDAAVEIEATSGGVRGERRAGVAVFRGIPYARPPLGPLRFAPPQFLPPWSGVRDCRSVAAIAPQLPSRLRTLMGDEGGEQSEDCLTLTVWAPSRVAMPRAVMVWLHGGAYMTGAGALGCYEAESLALTGDVVVVAPNFRQGALGFLHLPGVSDGNLGLLDIATALTWVQQNIAAFGGDPSQVTVFGQSSGASCIRNLMSMPAARGLFQRAILQSAALGRGDRSPEVAEDIGRRFAGALQLKPTDRDGFLNAPISSLLVAQGEVTRSLKAPLGSSELPFTPVLDGRSVLNDESGNWFAKLASPALVIGFNAQEMEAWHALDPQVQGSSREQALSSIKEYATRDSAANPSRWEEALVQGEPSQVLSDFYTTQIFGKPSLDFAKRMAARGVQTWAYRFDWQSPAGYKACHCLELPFVFDNVDRWDRAAMLEGLERHGFDGLAEKVQRAWTAFARNGNPDHDRLPHWPAIGHSASMMVFDILPTVQPIPA